MNKEIVLKTNEVLFFRLYLEAINMFKHLREREKDVLAYLLYFNSEFEKQGLPDEVKNKLLFDYDIKAKIKEKLNIKDDNFNTILSTLRQKSVLKGDSLNPVYYVYPEFPFTLSFKFELE